MRKQSKGNEQTLTVLSSAHHHSQTSYIKQIKFFLFAI